MTKEAGIHFELYRHLQNSIEEKAEYYSVRFGKAVPEQKVDSGSADIVIYDARKRPLVVIEAKREHMGGYDRNLDPYSPRVINQAFGYAGKLGAEYFATYNGSHLVLFRTFEKGVPLLDRKTRAYKIRSPKQFAPEFKASVLSQAGGSSEKHINRPNRRTIFANLHSSQGLKELSAYYLSNRGYGCFRDTDSRRVIVWPFVFGDYYEFLLVNRRFIRDL